MLTFNTIDADQRLLALKRQVASEHADWRDTVHHRLAYYRMLESERMIAAVRRMQPMRADAPNPKGFDFDVIERLAKITRTLGDASDLLRGARPLTESEMIDAEAMLRMHDELRGKE